MLYDLNGHACILLGCHPQIFYVGQPNQEAFELSMLGRRKITNNLLITVKWRDKWQMREENK